MYIYVQQPAVKNKIYISTPYWLFPIGQERVDEMRVKEAAKLKELKDGHEAALKDAAAAHEKALEALREQHKAAVASLEDQ